MDSDEARFLRAIAGDVGTQILKRRKEREPAALGNDPSMFAIRDWDSERLFQDIAIMDPELAKDPLFKHLYGSFRDEQTTDYLRNGGKDSLGGLAMLYTKAVSENHWNIIAFWDYMRLKGPYRQGDVIEIFGPMGSGKSNFLVWMMHTSIHYGFKIVSNIKLSHPMKEFIEVHSLSDTLIQLARLRKENPSSLALIIIDEQGAAVGASSRTANKRETRWSDKFITLIRKFGASLWRSRQFDSRIKEQSTLTTIEFTKNTANLSEANGEIKQGEYAGTEILFTNIPDEREKYDTNQISSYDFDIDMELFDKLVAMKEGKISEDYSMEDMIIEIASAMKRKNNKKTPEHVIELAEQGYAEKDIAEETGYSLKQVYNILNKID